MFSVSIGQPDDLDEFRRAARRLLQAGIGPGGAVWSSGEVGSLFGDSLPNDEKSIVVPRSFVTLAEMVICHRDDQRLPLLYEALWRIARGERQLMERASDPLVHRLRRLATAVKHDQHRMTAFVRFRMVPDDDGDHFIAWYEPQHRVLRRTATFFIDRFASMRFSILTPDLTLYWDGSAERFGAGLSKADAASDDAVENWWRRYYASTFNPARANVRLMQRHMPKRFWRDLPETSTLPGLIDEAGPRTDRMVGRLAPPPV